MKHLLVVGNQNIIDSNGTECAQMLNQQMFKYFTLKVSICLVEGKWGLSSGYPERTH